MMRAQVRPEGNRHDVQSVIRALRVLEAVGESKEPIGVAQLARELGLPKTTVQRNLDALSQAGWIRPDAGNGLTRWVLSMRAFRISRNFSPYAELRSLSLPYLQRIAAVADENAHLSVRDGDSMVVVERVSSTQPIQHVLAVGSVMPLASTASGQAYLAALPDAEVEAVLADLDLDAATRRASLEDVRRCRDRGYAIQSNLFRPGLTAVSCPVVDRAGQPVGALSVSAPEGRMSAEVCDRWGRLLVETARDLSAHL